MKLQQNLNIIELKKADTYFRFLESGDVRELLAGEILINQLLGNTMDGSINNLYLRVYENNELKAYPLLGKVSGSKFEYNEESVRWTGEKTGIQYEVVLTLVTEKAWCFKVRLKGIHKLIDIIYGQDISLANKSGTLTNELYMCQYIDHKVLKGKNGYVISSRQNQAQDGNWPYIQQGSIGIKTIGFSTDGMQFFGKSFKETDVPECLAKDLPNINYQYEMAYVALQTEKIMLDGETQVGFYGIFKDNYPQAVTKIDFLEEVEKTWVYVTDKNKEVFSPVKVVEVKEAIGKTFQSETFTEEELDKFFPERLLEEKVEDLLLSFFAPGHRHIVLSSKEGVVERPHGHIITTALDEKKISSGLMTSTNYIYGVFNSQVVVGNTNLNKMLSTARSIINSQKNSGQRIYIKVQDKYCLLAMPAAYELGVNYAKWFYKVEKDVVIVSSYAVAEQADIVLEVISTQGKLYEYIVTNQMVMGEHEYLHTINMEVKDNVLKFVIAHDTFTAKTYPELNYIMEVRGAKVEVSDDRIFYKDNESRNGTLVTLKLEATCKFQVVMAGRLNKEGKLLQKEYTLEREIKKYNKLYERLSCRFNLTLEGKENSDLDKINEIFWWYTHNAMVHYATPHGLEQPGGAAWGTRDICQGPIEYFFATQHYEMVREIIKEIFSHQFFELGEWPQWFMFDDYRMQQDDCHGDIVFWPLKVISEYLAVTGDMAILEEQLLYRHEDGRLTAFTETLKEHIMRAVEVIKGRFLYDTALISYAGGDWDDTLQPSNKALKEKLVSAWTVALAYQSLNQLAQVVAEDSGWANELTHMAQAIKKDFNALLIKDGIIAGFVYYEDAERKEYMLHPEDKKTGIQYRLLPMTRSIISELVTKQQARVNLEMIEKHLKCTDGVRLMNAPANYEGGVSKIFQRAEQASNVGREIGLNYIHAHIRYIEAMAKVGDANEVWDAMMCINPILIQEKVPNALTRQSNAYFSSSDGLFNDRYEYQTGFAKLRNGDVSVKGGWRIYSSGPGIYLNQMISNILGIRHTSTQLIIDPVLAQDKDGLTLSYDYNQKATKWVFHIKGKNQKIKNVVINGETIEFTTRNHTYRESGVAIDKALANKYLQEKNEIHIYMQ